MDCFGDSDDEEAESSSNLIIQRDPSCGVCCFHSNTETSLLTHVRNSLHSLLSSSTIVEHEGGKRKLRRTNDVLHAIDDFCTSRHWMMHIGPEKGEILTSALKDALEQKIFHCTAKRMDTPVSFVAVELGTYCAYASILMGKVIYETMQQHAEVVAMDCHLFTTEIDQEYAKIATKIIQLSDMEDVITVHEIGYNGRDTDIVETIADAIIGRKDSIRSNQSEESCLHHPTMIDFLFIDHDKDAYKSDLCKLEVSGMIQTGTRVVADNVLFACIDDYVKYVQQKMELGIVQTRTILSRVEYSGSNENLQDGIGKCVVLHAFFLGGPLEINYHASS